MHRKIVFRGSLLTKDLSDEDKVSLAEAFATLHRLSDAGVIQFQRNAGKTASPARKPDNVLTPQALAILRIASAVPEIQVADVTLATGFNRNSVTAHLYRLADAGFLSRRQADVPTPRSRASHRVAWHYAITDEGRAALPDAPSEEDGAEMPAPR